MSESIAVSWQDAAERWKQAYDETAAELEAAKDKINLLQVKLEVEVGNYEGIKETQIGIIKQRDYWEERCRAAEAERDDLLRKSDLRAYALEQVQQANEALRKASEGQRKIVDAALAWNEAPHFADGAEIEALIAVIDAYRAEREKGATDEQR